MPYIYAPGVGKNFTNKGRCTKCKKCFYAWFIVLPNLKNGTVKTKFSNVFYNIQKSI